MVTSQIAILAAGSAAVVILLAQFLPFLLSVMARAIGLGNTAAAGMVASPHPALLYPLRIVRILAPPLFALLLILLGPELRVGMISQPEAFITYSMPTLGVLLVPLATIVCTLLTVLLIPAMCVRAVTHFTKILVAVLHRPVLIELGEWLPFMAVATALHYVTLKVPARWGLGLLSRQTGPTGGHETQNDLSATNLPRRLQCSTIEVY